MATDEKYILSLTKEQALAVSKACEFYSRVMMGQFGEIAYETMLQSIKQDDFCTRREMMEDLLFQARQFAFPDLMGRGHSYGIGHNKSADLAWNAYQALRYANDYNLCMIVNGKQPEPTPNMKNVGTGGCFKSLRQSAGTSEKIARQSFYGLMQEELSSKPDYYKRLFGKGHE